MKDETAFHIAREILLENHENGELEGTLNRSRVAALNRVLLLAEPEFRCCRWGTQLVIYQRRHAVTSGLRKYRRVGSFKVPGSAQAWGNSKR